jgi:miniconductance mechanosensitive channel
MLEKVNEWMAVVGVAQSELATIGVILVLVILSVVVVHVVFHSILLRILNAVPLSASVRQIWDHSLHQLQLFTRLAFVVEGVLVYLQADLWLKNFLVIHNFIILLTQLWILFFSILVFFSLLDTLRHALKNNLTAQRFPVGGMVQGLKLIASLLGAIIAIGALLDKSPMLLISSLGAMTAVLLLVFKDPLMGLVAGIQISANDMLRVGDWLEMPKYGADGEVTDINLTTVKVRNWDMTYSTIPCYALISDSFKNWRGMSEASARRIKRAVYLDLGSVRFLTEDEVAKLSKLTLLEPYITRRQEEIMRENATLGEAALVPGNGRKLTNIGTFRAYLYARLRANMNIRQDMTLIVRQLEPGTHGVPLEVYCFSALTDWILFEDLQSDIFDHILVMIPEFGLRLYQQPSGFDMQKMGSTR